MSKWKIIDIVGFIGSIASIISLFCGNEEWSIAQVVPVIFMVVLTMIITFFVFIKGEKKVYHTQDKINELMKHWIDTDGVVKVLSRDLSWVDKDMMGVIQAKGEDLHLYVQSRNSVVENIQQVNPKCKIFYYGEYGFEPNSRYTIVHANKDDRQIAVALQEQRTYKRLHHEIYISKDSAYDKKMLGLAMDLMKCIECMEENQKENG